MLDQSRFNKNTSHNAEQATDEFNPDTTPDLLVLPRPELPADTKPGVSGLRMSALLGAIALGLAMWAGIIAGIRSIINLFTG